ncbi:hypothetical protein pb186bvf_016901 [Paramecium bursaria]
MNQDKQLISVIQNIIRSCLDDYIGKIIEKITQSVIQELRNKEFINLQDYQILQEQEIYVAPKFQNNQKYIPSMEIQLVNLTREIEQMKLMFREENKKRMEQFYQVITNVIDSQQILINQKTKYIIYQIQYLQERLSIIRSPIKTYRKPNIQFQLMIKSISYRQ